MIKNLKSLKNIIGVYSQKTLKSNTVQSERYFSTSKKYDIQNILQQHYQKNQLIKGYATQSGTKNYFNRFVKQNNENNQQNIHSSFYKIVNGIKNQNILVSSLGIGTQNAEPTPEHDYKMIQALLESMTTGINYIDTDINFRFGKSQKIINAALNFLIKKQKYSRQEFFVSTKMGYIPTDIDSDLTPQKIVQILKKDKYINSQNIVEDIYGWGQGFIQFCVQKSRVSLGLQTIDCLFLNNFSQAQMSLISEDQFASRLKRSFRHLEGIRQSGRIRSYGVCSFVGFRSPPDQNGVHLNLQKILKLAKQSAGQNNGLKFIMLPLNLGMPQALLKWQKYKSENSSETLMRIFQIAEKEKINVVTCSPLFQGRVASLPFASPKLNFLKTNAAKHLHFIRSINSSSLLTTVFGSINPQHVKQNIQGKRFQPLSVQDWKSILPIPQ